MIGPAGWFPDPSGANGQRYFDGTQWTQNFAPHAAPVAASVVAVAVANGGGGSAGGMHVVHLLLTLLTCGMWLPIWIICAVIEAVSSSNRNSTAVSVGGQQPLYGAPPVYGAPSPVVAAGSSNAGKIVGFIVAGIFSLFFGLVLLGLIIEHPWLLLVVIPAFVAAGALFWRHRDNKLKVFERYRRDVIAHRADVEHNLAQQGDPRGTYGAYPPAAEEDSK